MEQLAQLIFPFGNVRFNNMDIRNPIDISVAVKKRRKSLSLTQAKCAAFCGVGLRFFSELENGKQSLHLGKVLQVLQMLGLKTQITENEAGK